MKGYSSKLSDVYVLPLPYATKALPPLILHNPLSVVLYVAAALRAGPAQRRHRGELAPDGARGVRVADAESAALLWQQGFFGKGSLSRSEPSWFGRTARRLGLDGGALSLEEITELRREKRRRFKRERELQQQHELREKLRREGALLADDDTPAPAAGLAADAAPLPPPVRDEDRALVRGNTIERLEFLQLAPCEAVFLALALGVLDVAGLGVEALLRALLPTPAAWREYAVYHYFRSLGWCVRDGVKFGADFLLYRRGPPFQHAEFAAMVMDPQRAPPWWWLHANMRVLGGAKKTLLLVYVERAAPYPRAVRSVNEFRQELQRFAVKPVTFARFAPSRNRD